MTATVTVTLDGESHRLDPADARRLRGELATALAGRTTYVHTAGHQRLDGSYVVERRRADSDGHRKVFSRFETLRALYRDLPREFDAEAVGREGLTGPRRHLLVRHVAEHPAFDCELTSRQPLTVTKRDTSDPVTEHDTDESPTEHDPSNPVTEHDADDPVPERPGREPGTSDPESSCHTPPHR